ncbi:MAG: tetratricopeptide repeat protein [Verrucomicrobiota bacterium]
MAHSPVEVVDSESARGYFDNWDHLSTLITQGRSFSGRERHCAFLNRRGKTFDTVSAVTGLDFIDDGRGLAVTDWDGDGDLDLWMTQRNGPRIRYVRNDSVRHPVSLTLYLEGVRCNRDAVGSRVEMVTSEGRVLARTVRAGDSFLSQSTKALSFGLQATETIEWVRIFWPGDRHAEEVRVGGPGFYRVRQGGGEAIPLELRKQLAPLAASRPEEPTPQEGRRLVLMHRGQISGFRYVSFEGDLRTFAPGSGKPTLINLWASRCAPCVHELDAFSEAWDSLSDQGLHLLALNTDSVVEGGEKPDLSRAKALVAGKDYPFAMGLIDAKTVQALTLVLHRALAVQPPLSLPSSFLLDAEGKVRVIYQGAVEVDVLREDINLLEASMKVIEDASFPFPGRNGFALFPVTPLDFARAFQAGGYADDARRVITDHLMEMSQQPGGSYLKEQYYLGTLEQSRANWPAAVAAYEKTLAMAPDRPAIHVPLAVAYWQADRRGPARAQFSAARKAAAERPSIWTDLGRAYLQIGQGEEAVLAFEEAVKANPEGEAARSRLAGAFLEVGRAAEGIELYERLLAKNPAAHQVANQLAWIYATHPGKALRKADRSLELASSLAELTKFRDPRVLDTLAAAEANQGRFEKAAEQAAEARRLARAIGERDLAREISLRLKRYEAGAPWRQS